MVGLSALVQTYTVFIDITIAYVIQEVTELTLAGLIGVVEDESLLCISISTMKQKLIAFVIFSLLCLHLRCCYFCKSISSFQTLSECLLLAQAIQTNFPFDDHDAIIGL